VDTAAFEHLPEDWIDVAAETEVPADGALPVDASRVRVLLSLLPDGIVALADRCTHRGGPLHEGIVAEGCVTCPWHGSTFDLRTGYVVDGPASRPEPRLEVQTLDGRVRVRRAGAGN
jgi:nitrite reductase/ring-hydroxylating ferredoxin subunit